MVKEVLMVVVVIQYSGESRDAVVGGDGGDVAVHGV